MGRSQHHDPVPLVDAVRVAGVARRGGLPIGRRRPHTPVAGRPEDPEVEKRHAGLLAGEPVQEGGRFEGGVSTEQSSECCGVGGLERCDVLLEQRTCFGLDRLCYVVGLQTQFLLAGREPAAACS
jgi:hypothetical protein